MMAEMNRWNDQRFRLALTRLGLQHLVTLSLIGFLVVNSGNNLLCLVFLAGWWPEMILRLSRFYEWQYPVTNSEVLVSFDFLHAAEWEPLLEAAWSAWDKAYVPYSHFRVGAAIKCLDGSIVAGCNVENASYPVTLCAERTALCAAVSQGLRPGGLEALAVVTETGTLAPPCGVCRQVLAEFAEFLPILLANRSSRALLDLRDLFPQAFTGRNLDLSLPHGLPNPGLNP
jgi:cytidine deaminase